VVSNNLLKEDVKETVKEVLETRDEFCDCKQCQEDVMALALSELRPRYAGSEEGRVVMNSTDVSSTQTRMDIFRTVVEAAEKVNETPHHDR